MYMYVYVCAPLPPLVYDKCSRGVVGAKAARKQITLRERRCRGALLIFALVARRPVLVVVRVRLWLVPLLGRRLPRSRSARFNSSRSTRRWFLYMRTNRSIVFDFWLWRFFALILPCAAKLRSPATPRGIRYG